MKKSVAVPLLVLSLSMLAGALAVLPSVPVTHANGPNTAATSTIGAATAYAYNHQICQANGRFWVWFYDGTNAGFVSSTDGSTWSSETTITTGGNPSNGYAAFYCSGVKVYYAMASGSGGIYYRYGTLNSDGTVTWSIAEGFFAPVGSPTSSVSPSIAIDSNGNWWVGSTDFQSPYDYIYASECTTPSSCSWTSTAIADNGGYGALVALTSGHLMFVYSSTSGSAMSAYEWTGSAWSSVATSSGSTYTMYQGDVVGLGATAEICAPAGGATIYYASVTYGGTSFTETSLNAGTTCGISTDNAAGLAVIYGNGNTVYYQTSANSGGAWGTQQTLSSSESTPVNFGAISIYAGTLYSSWTNSGGSSPFNVRFGSVAFDVTEAITCTPEPAGLPTADLPTIGISGGSPSPSSFTCDGSAHNISLSSSTAFTLTNPTGSSTVQWVFAGNGTSNSDTGHGTSCASGTCSGLSFKDYQEISESWQIVAEAQSKFDIGLGVTFTGEQAGTSSRTVCSITTTSAATNLCSGWNDNGTAIQVPGSLTGSPVGRRWENQAGTTTDTPTLAGQTISYELFKQYNVTNGAGITSFSGDYLGSSASDTKSSFLDAGTVTVTGTASCAYTLSAPSYAYQFGSSQAQLWVNTTASSLTDGTANSPPTASFSATKASVDLCIGGLSFTGASVTDNGASIASTFASPHLTFKGSSAFVVTFSTSTQPVSPPGCSTCNTPPPSATTTTSAASSETTQSGAGFIPPGLFTIAIALLLIVLVGLFVLSRSITRVDPDEKRRSTLSKNMRKMTDPFTVDLDLSHLTDPKKRGKKKKH